MVQSNPGVSDELKGFLGNNLTIIIKWIICFSPMVLVLFFDKIDMTFSLHNEPRKYFSLLCNLHCGPLEKQRMKFERLFSIAYF